MKVDGALKCNIVGITPTSTATATSYALPNADINGGSMLKAVRVAIDAGASAYAGAYIKFGQSAGVTATTNDVFVSTSNGIQVFEVAGMSYVSVLANATVGAKVNIVPVQE